MKAARQSAKPSRPKSSGGSNDPPQPGAPRPYHFPHIHRTTLDNGLRVLVAENHNAPIVALRTIVKSGADKYQGGSAYYFENSSLVADNLTDDLKAQGVASGSSIALKPR